MGSRGSARVKKPAKKSKFSAQEKMDRARLGASTARRVWQGLPRGQITSSATRSVAKQIGERYKRNPLPRANRTPRSAPGGGAPRRQRG